MSESAAVNSGNGEKAKKGFFGRIFLFLRQVISELKKVVTPTRSELINYTLVVIGFVCVVMLIVTILDFVLGQGSILLFTNQPEQ
ncbi:preprotein translocase subunit SecE [Glutamicibacter sp. 287]|uniref:preprotein translocase subunit SecE n=1 Tax=unclassified Glutamicibacter TaxID=2627139 RepID=UPI000BB7417C|nr:preprotein translocase subunit SecE [Glutamicibacter sp. BW80]PCC29941.1 preprotein translocase subunit SecE [Glutamicibacter sp. BW80]